MENDPLKLYNKKTFAKLFESSSDVNEKLYKNTLLDFGEDFQSKNIDETNIIESDIKEFTHNSLLNRISMEDYYLFPPKTESLLVMEDGNLKEKQEPERLNEKETEFLQKINRLNYLTFSPFGESFFPHKFNQKDEKENNTNDNINKNKKEEKMLDILDFEYENYLLNNDLLFKISMGYVDIKKLKKENIVSNDYFISKKEKINQEEKKSQMIAKIKKENPNKPEFKYEVPFKQDLFNSLQIFAYRHRNEDFFLKTISEFNSDMNNIAALEKNSEKNRLLLKWENEFKDKQIKYNLYLQKKKRMERKEIKLQKEKEQELYNEQKKIDEQQKLLESELNKLKNKGKKRNFLQSEQRHAVKSVESSSSNANKYRKANDADKNSKNKRKLRTVSNKKKKDGPKTERINWINQKK